MRLLVTGGAGYIGSAVASLLADSGHEVVVLDDLSTGYADAVPAAATFVRGTVRDDALAVLSAGADAVLHFAAKSLVAESVANPLRYYRDNLDGVRALLQAVLAYAVPHVLFSSTAAVYGTPRGGPVTEDDPTGPENPYGRSKLVGEWMLRDAATTGRFSWAALRYFNVAGAAAPRLRDHGQTNLVPRLLRAAAEGEPAAIAEVVPVVPLEIAPIDAAGALGELAVEQLRKPNHLGLVPGLLGLAHRGEVEALGARAHQRDRLAVLAHRADRGAGVRARQEEIERDHREDR